MGDRKTPRAGQSKTVSISPQNGEAFIQKTGSAERADKQIESELAADILAELYPLLLENCTDEDDEVDTQVLFETLAGLVGLFMADYGENYGDEKAKAVFQDLVDMALNVYDERQASKADED